jgi:hypothetical protein
MDHVNVIFAWIDDALRRLPSTEKVLIEGEGDELDATVIFKDGKSFTIYARVEEDNS